jgi:hypothetical protein
MLVSRSAPPASRTCSCSRAITDGATLLIGLLPSIVGLYHPTSSSRPPPFTGTLGRHLDGSPALSRSGSDVVVVEYVAIDSLDLDGPEASLGQHLAGSLFSPHCAQPESARGKRHSHAVHARDCVRERPQGMVEIAGQLA